MNLKLCEDSLLQILFQVEVSLNAVS